MTEPARSDDSLLLVHAYLDGELDPVRALEVERRMASEPAWAAERDRVAALRRLVRERLPAEAMPPGLAARIERLAGRPRAAPSWRALAASVALAAVLGSGATWFVLRADQADVVADALVADHIRALMTQPTDVSSSDRHTVKPWFNGRIPQAPRVVDLTQEGFPLVGGRIDVVGRTPVPTLVYRHRQHLISLTAVPAAAEPGWQRRASDGYHLVRWRDGDVTYWAVSDLRAADLDRFAQAFRDAPSEQ